ncbi:unnamed protein product, partial [Gulo gulo]
MARAGEGPRAAGGSGRPQPPDSAWAARNDRMRENERRPGAAGSSQTSQPPRTRPGSP